MKVMASPLGLFKEQTANFENFLAAQVEAAHITDEAFVLLPCYFQQLWDNDLRLH